jgi:D-amino-acid oxidase
MARPNAIVVGCGVSGLTCAHELARAGFSVEIWTRELPQRTTSSVAGAIWYPFKVAPKERVAQWASESYAAFERLARDPASGVTMCTGVELLPHGTHDEAAEYRACARNLRELARAELPAGFARGFELDVPVVEMPLYLRWLESTVRAAGVRIVERTLVSLAPALDAAPLVVNCTALGSRELLGDRELRPIRGQLVRVERGSVERFVLDDFDPRGVTYVIPRSTDCIVGGTTDDGAEELVPSDADTHSILQRCRELEPRLAAAQVLGVSVGLRPARTSVRVEREVPRPGVVLVHDYGHGGAGVTLSWGCAREVVRLATLE